MSGGSTSGTSDTLYFRNIAVTEGSDLRLNLPLAPTSGLAGAMVRDSLAPDAPFVLVGIDPVGNTVIRVRRREGEVPTTIYPENSNTYSWFRLVVGRSAVYVYGADQDYIVSGTPKAGTDVWNLLRCVEVDLKGVDDRGGAFTEHCEISTPSLFKTQAALWSEKDATAPTSIPGDWSEETSLNAIGGKYWTHDAVTGGQLNFTLDIRAAQTYRIFLHCPEDGIGDLSVTIGTTTYPVPPNEPILPNDFSNSKRGWRSVVVTSQLPSNTPLEVRVNSTAGGLTAVDAVRATFEQQHAWQNVWWTAQGNRTQILNNNSIYSGLKKIKSNPNDSNYNDWNGAGYSPQYGFYGDFCFQFQVPDNDMQLVVGAANTFAGVDYANISHRFTFTGASSQFTTSGGGGSAAAPYSPSDWFSIDRVGGHIQFRKNGVIVHQSSAPMVGDYTYLDASLKTLNGRFVNSRTMGWQISPTIPHKPSAYQQSIIDANPEDEAQSLWDRVNEGDDADGDGLTNDQELNPADPLNVSNPGLKDTDRDGISDFDEVTIHHTRPSKWDSDGDEISDWGELFRGFTGVGSIPGETFGFNPNEKFTINDGVSDKTRWQILTSANNTLFHSVGDIDPNADFDSDKVSNRDESEDGSSAANEDDYFLPVLFENERRELGEFGWVGGMGDHSHAELTYPLFVGDRSYLTTKLIWPNELGQPGPGIKSGGYSHHYLKVGSRFRFQFSDPTKRCSVGFRYLHYDADENRAGFKPGDPPHYEARIETSNGEVRIYVQDGNEPQPAYAFAVPASSSPLIEMRIEAVEDRVALVFEVDHEEEYRYMFPTGTQFETEPMVVAVALAEPGAGILNARYRSVQNPDFDGDQIRDLWEKKIIELFPNRFTSIQEVDPGGDADEDLLTNIDEYGRGTKGYDVDHDEDGMWDGWEVLYGLNPKVDTDAGGDADGDGLTNLEEFEFRVRFGNPALGPYDGSTDPTDLDGDTDNDGVSDYWESRLEGRSPVVVEADAQTRDSDSDGIPDQWEASHGLDPSDRFDASEDPDHDLLSNLVEFRRGTVPRVTWVSKTIDFEGHAAAKSALENENTPNYSAAAFASFTNTSRLYFPRITDDAVIFEIWDPAGAGSGGWLDSVAAEVLGADFQNVSILDWRVNAFGEIAFVAKYWRNSIWKTEAWAIPSTGGGAVSLGTADGISHLSLTRSGFATFVTQESGGRFLVTAHRSSLPQSSKTPFTDLFALGTTENGNFYSDDRMHSRGVWTSLPEFTRAVSPHGQLLSISQEDGLGLNGGSIRLLDSQDWVSYPSNFAYHLAAPGVVHRKKSLTHHLFGWEGAFVASNPGAQYRQRVEGEASHESSYPGGAPFPGGLTGNLHFTGFNARGDLAGWVNVMSGPFEADPESISSRVLPFFWSEGRFQPFLLDPTEAPDADLPWTQGADGVKFEGLTDFAEVLVSRAGPETQWEVWIPDNDGDGDGIADDWFEQQNGVSQGTPEWSFDPRTDFRLDLSQGRPDRDLDHLPDAWEILFGFDPKKSDNGNADSDGDTLSDYEEYLNERNPHSADAPETLVGLLREVVPFQRPDEPHYATDGPDTDGDGMPDAFEVHFDLDPLDENDAKRDLDRDRVSNLEEFLMGTDPADSLGWITHLTGRSSLSANQFDEVASVTGDSVVVTRSRNDYRTLSIPEGIVAPIVLGNSGEIAATLVNPVSEVRTVQIERNGEWIPTLPRLRQSVVRELPGGDFLIRDEEDVLPGALAINQGVYRHFDTSQSLLRRIIPVFPENHFVDRFVGPLLDGSSLSTGRGFEHGSQNGELFVHENSMFRTQFRFRGQLLDLTNIPNGLYFAGIDANSRGEVVGVAVEEIDYSGSITDGMAHLDGKIFLWRDHEFIDLQLPSIHRAMVHSQFDTRYESPGAGLSIEPVWLDLGEDGTVTALVPPVINGVRTPFSVFSTNPDQAIGDSTLVRWKDGNVEEITSYTGIEINATPNAKWPKFVANAAGDLAETARYNPDGEPLPCRTFIRGEDERTIAPGATELLDSGATIYSSSGKITYWQVQDSDSDGMSDDWERLNGLLTPQVDSQGIDQHGPDGDLDSDGLNNFVEYRIGSNPRQEDSDGDGLQDGWEYRYGYGVTSPDDTFEDVDSDGYDLTAEAEVGSDPFDPTNDRDGDGISDRYEFIYLLNPDDASDGGLDEDGDGLSNYLEARLNTAPKDRDTDDDDVIDSIEVWGYPTDPKDEEDFVDFGGILDLRPGDQRQFYLSVPNTLGRTIQALVETATPEFEGLAPAPDVADWIQLGQPEEAGEWEDIRVPVTIAIPAYYQGGSVTLPFAIRESSTMPGIADDLIVGAALKVNVAPVITLDLVANSPDAIQGEEFSVTVNASVPPGATLSEVELYLDGWLVQENLEPQASTVLTFDLFRRYGENFVLTAVAYDSAGFASPVSAPLQLTVNGVPLSTDGDGMPDYWEKGIVDFDENDEFTDITQVLDGGDFDGDGWTNLEEFQNETDPRDPDENADGIFDGRDGNLEFRFNSGGENAFTLDAQGAFQNWLNSGTLSGALLPSADAPAIVEPAFRSGATGLGLSTSSGLKTSELSAPLDVPAGWTLFGVFEPDDALFDLNQTTDQTLLKIENFVRVSASQGRIRLQESHPDASASPPMDVLVDELSPADRESWGVSLRWDPTPDASGATWLELRAGPLTDWATQAKTLDLELPARIRTFEGFSMGALADANGDLLREGLATLSGEWLVEDGLIPDEQVDHYFSAQQKRWRPGEPQAPSLSITKPATDSRFGTPALIHLEATVEESDAPITQVAFYLSGALLGTDYEAPYEFMYDARGEGPQFLTVKATDALGNLGVSDSRTILLRNTGAVAPVRPIITLPGPGKPIVGNPFKPNPGGGGPGNGGPGNGGPGNGGGGPGNGGNGGTEPDDTEDDFDGDGRADSEDWVDYDKQIDSWDRTGVPRFAVIETGNFIPWKSNKFGMVLGYVGAQPDVNSEWFVWYQGKWMENKLDIESSSGSDPKFRRIPTISQEHPLVYGSANEKRSIGCDGEDIAAEFGFVFTPSSKFKLLEESPPSGGENAGSHPWNISGTEIHGSVEAIVKDEEDGECHESRKTATVVWAFDGSFINPPIWPEEEEEEEEEEPKPEEFGQNDDDCYPSRVPLEPPGHDDDKRPVPGPFHVMIGGIKATTFWERCREERRNGQGGMSPEEFAAAWKKAAEEHNQKVDVWKPGDECPKFNPPGGAGGGGAFSDVPKRGEFQVRGVRQDGVTDPRIKSQSKILKDPIDYDTDPPLAVVTRGSWRQGSKVAGSKCNCEPGTFTRDRRVLWISHDGKNELVELRNDRDGGPVDIGTFSKDRTFTVGADGLGGLWADGAVHKWEDVTGGKSISQWNYYVGREGLSCAKGDGGGMILLPVDLDIDSDNNNGFEMPDRSGDEESVEDYSSGGQPTSDKPGKVILIGNSDSDKDGIVDLADGFDLKGGAMGEDDESSGLQFVPLVLDVSSVPEDVEFKLEFPESEPSRITDTVENPFHVEGDGKIRIWTKNGDEARNKEPFENDGDLIKSDVAYLIEDLQNLSNSTSNEVTLYVEAVKRSESIADIVVKLHLKFPGSNEWIDEEEIVITAVEMELWGEDDEDLGYTLRDRFAASTLDLNETDLTIVPDQSPGIFAKYRIRIYDPRTSGIDSVTVGGEELTLSRRGSFYETEEFLCGSGQSNFPGAPSVVISGSDEDKEISYNPFGWFKSEPKVIPPPDADKIVADVIKDAVDDMQGSGWSGGGGGNGAFGIEVDRRVGAALTDKPGWYSNVRVNNATMEIVSVNGTPVLTPTTNPPITNTTEVDLLRTRKGADNKHITLKVGDTWNRANIEEIYEIKTSITGKPNRDQTARLKALKGGPDPEIKLVNSEHGWTASKGWHLNRKWVSFVRVFSIVGGSTAVYAWVRSDKYEPQLERLMELADNVRRNYPVGHEHRIIAANALLQETRNYLANFFPDTTVLDIATLSILYTKVFNEEEFAPIE